MKKTVLSILLLSLVLAGCNKQGARVDEDQATEQVSPEAIKREKSIQLLNDISGVWASQGSMVTIYYHDNQMQFIIDKTPIMVKIGDIDLDNQTVNLLVTKNTDNEEEILTIRKVDNEAETNFHIVLTSFVDGSTQDFNFVRTIGTDDKNRINRIYKQAQDEADNEDLQQKSASTNSSQAETDAVSQAEMAAQSDDSESYDSETENSASER